MIDWLFRNHTPARHPSVLNVTRTRAHCANIRRRMAAAFSISRKRSVRWTVVIDHTIDLSVSSRVSRSSIMALASAALPALSPVSVQTQSIALASSQSWLPLLRPSIPIGIALAFVAWKRKRLRFLRFSFTQRTQRTQRKRLRLNGNRALYWLSSSSTAFVGSASYWSPGQRGDTHTRLDLHAIFTCVIYAEARNRYRLDVRPSVRLSVRHTLALYQNGWIYCHAFFTTR